MQKNYIKIGKMQQTQYSIAKMQTKYGTVSNLSSIRFLNCYRNVGMFISAILSKLELFNVWSQLLKYLQAIARVIVMVIKKMVSAN